MLLMLLPTTTLVGAILPPLSPGGKLTAESDGFSDGNSMLSNVALLAFVVLLLLDIVDASLTADVCMIEGEKTVV